MYVSIDIETTGLDRAKDQILEVAAVVLPEGETDPWRVRDFPSFHCFVRHERLSGSVVALSMNSRIIDILSDVAKNKRNLEEPPHVLWPKDVGPEFTIWLNSLGLTEPRCLFPLGQNVGSFDMPFLSRLENWPEYRFHYRALSVGNLFATRDGVPSLKALNDELEFNIPGNVHEALYDARVALACAMYKFRQCDG